MQGVSRPVVHGLHVHWLYSDCRPDIAWIGKGRLCLYKHFSKARIGLLPDAYVHRNRRNKACLLCLGYLNGRPLTTYILDRELNLLASINIDTESPQQLQRNLPEPHESLLCNPNKIISRQPQTTRSSPKDNLVFLFIFCFPSFLVSVHRRSEVYNRYLYLR